MWLISLFPEHKIALCLQCIESLTNVGGPSWYILNQRSNTNKLLPNSNIIFSLSFISAGIFSCVLAFVRTTCYIYILKQLFGIR
jgi:hypothetical protein